MGLLDVERLFHSSVTVIDLLQVPHLLQSRPIQLPHRLFSNVRSIECGILDVPDRKHV